MTEVRDMASEQAAKPPVASRDNPLARLVFVRIPFAVCGVLVLGAVAINVANVVGRYVFDAPVSWAEEVMSYGIIWGVFVAVAAITYQGNHLRMDLLVINARGWFARALGALTIVLMVTLFGVRDGAELPDRAALRQHRGNQHGRAHSAGLCARRAAGRFFHDGAGGDRARPQLSHRAVRLTATHGTWTG